MNVLGIQAFFYSHAAALLRQGGLAFFCEEEKLDRTKGRREGFPLLGIQAALERTGLGLEEVDEIAYPIDPGRFSRTLVRSAATALRDAFRGGRRTDAESISLVPDRVLSTLRYTRPFLPRLIQQRIRHGGIPGRLPPVAFVPHHEAHAASGFYTSGFDEAAVLVVDGMGETESSTLWHGRGLGLERLETIDFPNSLGEFYAAFTEYCGFKTYQQEGKLMGLAAYGGPDPDITTRMDRVLRVGDGSYELDPRYTVWGAHGHGASFSDALVELFGPPRGRHEEITDRHRQVAFAAQQRLEDATLALVKRIVQRTGCRKLCFTGGVAMNCKLNGAILASGLVDELHVLPASDDSGAALGAAMVRSWVGGADPRFALRHTYYGPDFPDAEIEAVLRTAKASYRHMEPGDVKEVAALLDAGKVVALFTGRNEFGARALGARSILADPRRPDMPDIVNGSVKRREKWRPFAPVVLDGCEADYFVDGRPSPYMMKAFAVQPEMRDRIPAVVHVDGTCRPQTIVREVNALYYDILQAFRERTGLPVLLNTSFNVRGEPIVVRPEEALRCYFATGLDALVLGSFLLVKDGG